MPPLSKGLIYLLKSHSGVLQPRHQRCRFGLLRFRSPLLTESISLSFPPVTEMFHFTEYCDLFLILFRKRRYPITDIRLPHSEITGSKPVCGSPMLIAAYHVLHRLLAPRHPLYALNNLIPFFLKSLVCFASHCCKTFCNRFAPISNCLLSLYCFALSVHLHELSFI